MNRHHAGDELHLDPTRCDAHGFCADLLPEIVELDEWGFPVFAGGGLKVQIPHDLTDAARRAVAACPLGALKVTAIEPGR